MVQIIQSGPSQSTLRQQAMDNALQGMVQGYAGYEAKKQADLLTQRQQALADTQTKLKMYEMGIANPDQALAQLKGEYKQTEIAPAQPAQYGQELAGPVMPGQSPLKELLSAAVPAQMSPVNPLGTYSEAKKAEMEAKKQLEMLDQEAKRADINYKTQQGKKLETMAPLEKEKTFAEIRKINAEAAKSKKETAQPIGKQISAKDVATFNEGNQIPTMLNDVKQIIASNADMFGPVAGRKASYNPYNERAQTADASLRTASQSFGRFMEGGVLRKEDEEKYRKMFPQLSDTPEVAANKLEIVNRLLVNKQNSTIDALKRSGYNVSGIEQPLTQSQVPQVLGTAQASGSPWLKYSGGN